MLGIKRIKALQSENDALKEELKEAEDKLAAKQKLIEYLQRKLKAEKDQEKNN